METKTKEAGKGSRSGDRICDRHEKKIEEDNTTKESVDRESGDVVPQVNEYLMSI